MMGQNPYRRFGFNVSPRPGSRPYLALARGEGIKGWRSESWDSGIGDKFFCCYQLPMARMHRIVFPGAIYYLMSSGNRGEIS